MTYRSAVDTHEVARLLPLQKLLLETDAPYFLPCGFDVSVDEQEHCASAADLNLSDVMIVT